MFLGMYALVAAMAAIAVGLRQTLGESVRGTYLVLFHRPATRRSLIGTKLFVGVIVYLACAACPILAYGHWAAMPGHHASPFEWSMTLPSWIIGFDMTILYGGAFLSGIRQGRWFGTRLLPLIGTITILITVIANLSRVALGWPNGLVTIAINVCLLTAILFVAQNRDYS
jgi:hypothetical protein